MSSETTDTPRTRVRYFLLGLMAALAFGGAIAVVAVGLGGGEARAAASDIVFSKSNGVVGAGDVAWTITVQNNSDASQVVQVSDTYQPGGTSTQLTQTYEAPGPLFNICFLTPLQAGCTLTIPAHTTATLTLHSSLPADQCQASTATNDAFATLLGIEVAGSPDNGNTVAFAGHPELCDARNVFELCKVWEAEGVMNTPRSFTFNVSDSSETQNFTISGVDEGGGPHCILLLASGLVTVTETVPSGFLVPGFDLSTEDDPALVVAPNAAQFFLSSNECFVPTNTFLRRAQESISIDPGPDFNCTLTVTNRQVPTLPSPSVSPSPTIVICGDCFPFIPPTSTPVPPTATPTRTNTPVVTPVPPTATPTTVSGVTDPNAVDAAKTAAAAITPLPPRTGDTQPGSARTPVNIAIALAGLAALCGGLAVLGARDRRRG